MPNTVATNMDRLNEVTQRAANSSVRINNMMAGLPTSSTHVSPGKNVYGFNTRSFTRIPGMLFEEVAQLVFSVGMDLVGNQEHKGSPDYRLMRQNLAWWLQAKPEVRSWGLWLIEKGS